MTKIENEIYKLLSNWIKQKENAIPDSSYYYYCYGIEQGLKLVLNKLK